ncbi:hypothetical protein GCM10011584_27320 [Nocardioides phosphati]|uniref:Zinc ribbon domain-containing protein n=1 Tax=Nocardioides phosphati TaxID=1867775 RepID=A0ABQ2NEG7_9ACTN|nr:hypothetical protein [Nocardioides phosphati]GGO91974.1 hypothetical protein GCM10011584_27320 [Nocardioides phosphati]
MDEKRCEWCGTLSPAEAEKCTLCRIPFSAPVPPPQDWSHLTGNIPVITAPLLETPAAAAAPSVPEDVEHTAPAPAPVVPQQVQRDAAVPQPVQVAAGFAAPTVPASSEVVPSVGEMATDAVRPESLEPHVPGWRAPDDPTLRVFADRLEERERRPLAGNGTNRRGRRRRRQFARLLVWLVALGLIAAFVILAPGRLPSF